MPHEWEGMGLWEESARLAVTYYEADREYGEVYVRGREAQPVWQSVSQSGRQAGSYSYTSTRWERDSEFSSKAVSRDSGHML